MYFTLTDEQGNPTQWPLTISQLATLFPTVSFPVNVHRDYPDLGVYRLLYDTQPDFDPLREKLVENTPARQADDSYLITYAKPMKTQSEIDAEIQSLINQHIAAVQRHMDNFARTRNYTDMASAVSYIGCGDPQFESEAQYCSLMRAQIWRTLYDLLDEVKSGKREMVISSEEVISALPSLLWPQ